MLYRKGVVHTPISTFWQLVVKDLRTGPPDCSRWDGRVRSPSDSAKHFLAQPAALSSHGRKEKVAVYERTVRISD